MNIRYFKGRYNNKLYKLTEDALEVYSAYWHISLFTLKVFIDAVENDVGALPLTEQQDKEQFPEAFLK